MAEIQGNDDHGKKGGKRTKQKKISIFVDFTPMVDMNMLLITFFMLCTSLSKPQTMEIVMPTDKDTKDQPKTELKASQAITLLLDKDDKLYHYDGEPNFTDYTSLQDLSYDSKDENSLRTFLQGRNREAIDKIRELKIQKDNLEIPPDSFTVWSSRIASDKNTPAVIIKATDDATYKNLIDALDELLISNVGRYMIVKIQKGDEFLLKNKETAGAYGRGEVQ
jgi:biopolymer transport protein ExbD